MSDLTSTKCVRRNDRAVVSTFTTKLKNWNSQNDVIPFRLTIHTSGKIRMSITLFPFCSFRFLLRRNTNETQTSLLCTTTLPVNRRTTKQYDSTGVYIEREFELMHTPTHTRTLSTTTVVAFNAAYKAAPHRRCVSMYSNESNRHCDSIHCFTHSYTYACMLNTRIGPANSIRLGSFLFLCTRALSFSVFICLSLLLVYFSAFRDVRLNVSLFFFFFFFFIQANVYVRNAIYFIRICVF